MSLKRTALQRKAELRRTAMPKRGTPLERARAAKKSRKDTGPSPAQRNLVVERAAGCCELCGVQLHDGTGWFRAHSFHHRRPRRQGGSRLAVVNSPANILLLCGTGVTGCHGRVEKNRTDAYAHHWLLRAGEDPVTTPVDIGPFHVTVFLTEDGEYRDVAP